MQMGKNHVIGARRALLCCTLLVPLALAACSSVPESVRLYAADLPARADGQYVFVSDDDIKKQLVLKDSELQCKIDVADGTAEEKSPACQCTKSAGDWLVDCKAWLGTHTPKPAPPAPTPASPSTPSTPGSP
jgi:hypothetical protein